MSTFAVNGPKLTRVASGFYSRFMGFGRGPDPGSRWPICAPLRRVSSAVSRTSKGKVRASRRRDNMAHSSTSACPTPGRAPPADGAENMRLNPLKRVREPETGRAGVYAALSAAIAPRIEEIFNAFYAELMADPVKARLLRDPATAARARDANLEHWRFLLSHPPDDELRKRAARIGETHVRVKLSPEIYLGAYGYFFKHFLRVILARHERERELAETLTELVFTDMGANLSTFFLGTERAARENEALELKKSVEAELESTTSIASDQANPYGRSWTIWKSS